MPRLSIVIVTYNSLSQIDACLASLSTHPPSLDHETLVVDNASRDGTAVAVRQRWPHVRVIDQGVNLGFAGASNVGIRQTSGELVLLLNPDTTSPAGALDALVASLDERPDAAVVGPRLVDARGQAELSFGSMIGPLAALRQKLLVTGNDSRRAAGRRVCQPADAARARGRLGQRRVLARTARRRGGGRIARRAVLYVRGGRRLLRSDPGSRTTGALHP